MGAAIVVQWVVIMLTILLLFWTNRGRSTKEKKAIVAYMVMALLLNVAYLFELMAGGQAAAFMALEIQYGSFIFMGYFICLFFCFYAKNHVPQWVAVYTLIYDLIMLVVVWTGNYHELMFKNVTYAPLAHGYGLVFEQGELFVFLLLGCELAPVLVSLFTVISYIGKENSLHLRGQILWVAVVVYASYACEVLFFGHVMQGYYNFAAPLGLLIVDVFVLRFWGRRGFHMETAAIDTVFENMQEGIIVLNKAKDLLYYNPAAKSVFPELEPELFWRNIRRLHSLPLELLEDYEQKEIDLGSRHYGVNRAEIYDSWSEVCGYVLVISDQTKEYNYIAEITSGRKKAESAQQEALRALGEAKKADRIKSDFLTNISHEIRTPMNAIVGLSELIIEESRGRKVYDFACDIKNASTNLLVIINDILSLSKLENGQMELAQEQYGTEQLIEETLHLSKVSAASRGLQLKREISKKLPCQLIGDPIRIRQMITNFLDFGMKYTERGYVKITLTHKWIDEERVLLVFQFEDTGVGFDEEELECIFDQFRFMDETKERNLESMGLGIALTKRFVDLMDGKVEAASEPGKGTTFTVCLPQKVADIRSIEQQPWRKHDVTEAIDRAFIVPDYRVLVVDDNKINLKVASGALMPYRFLVDEARSGAQAIELVKDHSYDLILMDHMMPEMDGIEATDHIRRECGENGKKPVIIALSANAYNNAKEMFMSNGFQDFISKPLDKDELHRMLCKWIPQERRQTAEGTKEANEKLERAGMAELYMTGVDVRRALEAHTGGVDDYLELLELYYMDGISKRELIERLAEDADYKNYEIEVHGLKSASANIGAYELSELARDHEFAVKEGNYEFVQKNVSKLVTEYGFLLREIERVLKTKGYLAETTGAEHGGVLLSPSETRKRMQEILNDVENFRPKDAAAKVETLLSENIEKSVNECLKDVRNRLKMYDDDTAEDLLRAFLGNEASGSDVIV